MCITTLRGATVSKNAKQMRHASRLTAFCVWPSFTVMWKTAPSRGEYSAGRSKETVHAPEAVT